MKVSLLRNADTEFGSFGHLLIVDDADQRVGRWHTCEDDWLNNQPNISCIPVGTYTCRRTIYQRYGIETFEVTGVPGRSRVLFHSGNTEEDTAGCILLGLDLSAIPVNDEDIPAHDRRLKWSVSRSREAFQQFMDALHGVQEFQFVVEWSQPGAWRQLGA